MRKWTLRVPNGNPYEAQLIDDEGEDLFRTLTCCGINLNLGVNIEPEITLKLTNVRVEVTYDEDGGE